MTMEILGCANHLGVGARGLKDNLKVLRQLAPALDLTVVPEIECPEPDPADPRLKNINSVAATCRALAEAADRILGAGRFPLNILGDHAASIGTVSATSRHVERLGLIWIDAHPDINTEHTTPSGNIHGMSVAALLNLADPRISRVLFDGAKVEPGRVVMIGLRDIDPGEAVILSEQGIRCFSYETVVRRGLDACLDEALDIFREIDQLHISLDMDAMDPLLVPGLSVPVASGFTPADVRRILNRLFDAVPVAAMDIVEFNPAFDRDHRTARVLLDLVELVRARVCGRPGPGAP